MYISCQIASILKRILADERAGALFERVLRSAFADAGDADVGLDRADHVALVEELIQIGRLVDANARDLRFRQRGFGELRPHERGSRSDRARDFRKDRRNMFVLKPGRIEFVPEPDRFDSATTSGS